MSRECPAYPKKNSPGAQVNVLKKCRTSRASGECAQINELLNLLTIQNKYVKCNTCPGNVRNIQKKQPWCTGKCPEKHAELR